MRTPPGRPGGPEVTGPAAWPPTVTVIGEALIDLVPADRPGAFAAFPGGSPHNIAIGLARLGHHTTLIARLADNTRR